MIGGTAPTFARPLRGLSKSKLKRVAARAARVHVHATRRAARTRARAAPRLRALRSAHIYNLGHIVYGNQTLIEIYNYSITQSSLAKKLKHFS